ncbi:hypothetical protein BKA56DRAFT_234006 [Ilyonectria sp. MPI-CAGE-AT-0026]|nr:hypothetical protein BKA56DRAFT_234006 [Ilyonectria sp. MPI-CAGE-AT-0026]
MMENGATSDSPPETGTGCSRGFWHELAPEASGTNLLPDWFPERVERAKCVITTCLTGPDLPYPYSGAAETIRRLGMFPRSLRADPRLTCFCAACNSLATSKIEKPVC